MDFLKQIVDFFTPSKPHPSIKAEPLFDLGPIHFTNSMLMTLVVIAVLVIFFALATRRLALVPSGAQNLAEAAVESLLGLTEGVAGKKLGRKIFPLIATLFIFILAANYLSLFPGVGSIGGCYASTEHSTTAGGEGTTTTKTVDRKNPCLDHPGTVFHPFLRAPNADLNTTIAMAIIAFVTIQVAGIGAHGVGGYVKELFNPIFMGPIHIVGELSRIISLSCRLFGNIFGGEVLLLVMYSLLGSVLVGFGTVIFLGLEILFGGIQALLFSLLTLTYITLAASGHGSSEAHGADDHSAVVQPQTGTEVHMA